jgi:putative endonuclease
MYVVFWIKNNYRVRDFLINQTKIGRIWLRVQSSTLREMDRLASRLRRPQVAPHLATGIEGEREALFYLRQQGYVIVARRWKTPKLRGDLDLIAWDGDWLCFIEVKARRSRGIVTAEAAIDQGKQKMLRKMARQYMRGFPERARREIPVRFDVVSVYMLPDGNEFELIRGGIRWA